MAAIYVLIGFVAATIILFLLPDWLGVAILFFIAKYKESIGYTILALLFIFGSYGIVEFIKNTEQPWQAARKKIPILLSVPFVIYACAAIFVPLLPTDYDRCDYYNERLDGGVREFLGKKYTVIMCGTGGDNRQSNDEIRLQVFSEQGELVAQRYFVVNWDESSPNRGIQYFPDHISYVDESLEKDFKKTIAMPPTIADWIRARLPLLN